jgi:hypothetical protein
MLEAVFWGCGQDDGNGQGFIIVMDRGLGG